jgi:hypothetical protein
MSSDSITSDPKLSSVSPEKLLFLSSLVSQMKGKSQSELLPFLMASMTQANEGGFNFTEAETSLLLEVLMQNMSESDRQKAELIINMIQKK